jgi:hypothetical protein
LRRSALPRRGLAGPAIPRHGGALWCRPHRRYHVSDRVPRCSAGTPMAGLAIPKKKGRAVSGAWTFTPQPHFRNVSRPRRRCAPGRCRAYCRG